jgi:hypothetical protein
MKPRRVWGLSEEAYKKHRAVSRLAAHGQAETKGITPVGKGARAARQLRRRMTRGLRAAKVAPKGTGGAALKAAKRVRGVSKSATGILKLAKGFRAAGKIAKVGRLASGLAKTTVLGGLVSHNITYSAPKIIGATVHGYRAASAEMGRRRLKKKSETKYGSLEAAARTRRRMTGGR